MALSDVHDLQCMCTVLPPHQTPLTFRHLRHCHIPVTLFTASTQILVFHHFSRVRYIGNAKNLATATPTSSYVDILDNGQHQCRPTAVDHGGVPSRRNQSPPSSAPPGGQEHSEPPTLRYTHQTRVQHPIVSKGLHAQQSPP